jgi:hypothetical protein
VGYELQPEITGLEFERLVHEGPQGTRTSVRFPLALPVRLMVSAKHYEAVTNNISASGVLLHLDEFLEPGTSVEFLIGIPEGIIAPNETAAVHCTGRIVRSYSDSSETYAAAVIDEYGFQ